ncbi:uncharacterized protein EV422DRAFT_569235 [Fimicolochytrium jonesii]|uniref:uncharacterized protein n=1 Tax=Fimicolochytrium jonesii TaxID=1396493 RepID=UPI0022FDE5B6|nr:uncharacterized protein EV422DRAFT_569235 [Fimicolochytrium jonesii]KAI8818957.1 hypothetical protein EV422DRAFT_569235 [Fimicolochytrium jonesii]
MSTETFPQAPRAIIQLDLDYFYAQAEEVKDPTLKEKPLAIQQKHIVVTCNYVARRYGIGKLALLADAFKLCPELVIRDGSDISHYRRVSRQIFEFVKHLLNGDNIDHEGTNWPVKIERLGMDELFLDVTDIIGKHCANIPRPEGEQMTSFKLPSGEVFQYDEKVWDGHVIGSELHEPSFTQHLQVVRIASHLAAFVRLRIKQETGFTSSAGISYNKMMSKLCAGAKKPNAQTTLIAGPGAEDFLGSMSLRKIPGIGRVVRKRIETDLTTMLAEQEAERRDAKRAEFGMLSDYVDATPGDEGICGTAGDPSMAKPPTFTVGLVRKYLSLEHLERTLVTKTAGEVWALLHGFDNSQVVSTGLPSQISIEDSFPHCATEGEVEARLLSLTTDFIGRMEEEEWIPNTSRWRRHAKTLRLTIRRRQKGNVRAWMDDRESRSVPMPVEVWDARAEHKERARSVVTNSLMPLFRKMCNGEPFDLTLLNIAAVNFEKGEVDRDIRGFFGGEASVDANPASGTVGAAKMDDAPSTELRSSHPRNGSALEDLDPDVLNELPDDIRNEIMASMSPAVGLPPYILPRKPADKGKKRVGNGINAKGQKKAKPSDGPLHRMWRQGLASAQSAVADSFPQPVSEVAAPLGQEKLRRNGKGSAEVGHEIPSDGTAGLQQEADGEEGFECPQCKQVLYVWSVESHARSHEGAS